MQSGLLHLSLILCLVAMYMTLALEVPTQSPTKVNMISLSDRSTLIREKRATSTRKTTTKRTTTTPKPGFFRTLFSVVYDQYQDTRNTIGTVQTLVNDNFLPENGTVQVTTPAPGSNATTTEDYRISRNDFNKIIMRNLRGLQNLFQIEMRQALKQSEKNYNEFRKNVTKEIGKFL